jgi:hypothetical protein
MWVRGTLVAASAGLAGGLVARLLFAVLPEPWGTLANTSALWGLIPFFVAFGLRARGWRGAAVGVVALAVTVVAWVLSSGGATGREIAMWAVIAVVAGALCGLAGGAARNARGWMRLLALAFIGGVVAGEALYGILLIGGPQWWVELMAGIALPLVLARNWFDRLLAVIGASVIACALYGAYVLYDAIAVL